MSQLRQKTTQEPYVITVTLTTAGTRQRLITDPASPYRFQTSFYVEADVNNTGKVFIGGSTVADSTYSTCLAAREGADWEGDELSGPGVVKRSQIDLYNTWWDADTNAQVLHITVAQDS